MDSGETLLTVIDERTQLARAAPGVTPVDSSEEGAPVRELIQLSVLGEPLVNNLQEPMPADERLEYAIQATAVIWHPLEQMRYAVSDDVDSDSFGMAPWDAGGMHGNDCECREWLIRLLCRPVIRNGLVMTTRMNHALYMGKVHALNMYRYLYLAIYASTVTDSTIGITLFIPAINDHYGYLTFTLRLSLFFDSKTLRLS